MAELTTIGGELRWLAEQFRQNWRPFLMIHLAVTAIVVALLGPALTVLLRLAVALSGDAALSDQDILFFFLTPAGFVSLSALAALGSVIVVLEYAALLAAAGLSRDGRPPSLRTVIVFLGRRGSRLFGLALLMLARVLLNLLPFLLLAALVYARLLTDYDINFYLAEQPPEWHLALKLGALIALAAGLNLLRLFVNWVLALPLLLFNDLGPAACLRESRAAARGRRLRTAGWLLGWLVFSTLLVAAVALPSDFLAQLLIPMAAGSTRTLLVFLGVASLIGAVLSFAVSFVDTALLSLLILRLFLRSGLWQGVRGSADESAVTAAAPGSAHRLPLWSLPLALAVSLLATWLMLDRLPTAEHSVAVAHRGASAAAPENTMAAVQGAIDSGAEWVEIDVQETADGQVVVIHDSDLKKVGGVALRVGESTTAALREVDIGSWFAPEFADERVPTLAEVLALCKDRIGVNIELKYYGHERRLEQSVAEIVEAAGMADQVVVMSLSLDGIRAMRGVRPDWTLGLLSSVALGNLARLDVDFLALNGRAATRRLIRHAHAQGKQVYVWTINDAVGMHSMLGRGVDGVITDEPALAVSVLQQRAELEPSQLLLMQLADLFDNPGLHREQ